ncbi:MAG: TonB family protein [Steroidobacteraceae bacterium]
MSDAPRQEVRAAESLVVLTRDAALVESLKALGSEHRVLTVAAESDLAEELLGEHPGVAIVDVPAAASPVERLTERLKSQFPDLVLIVAGGLRDQSTLAVQITNGTIYRFLHKPVSEQRVKHFVEAAWRRHTEEHAAVNELMAATGVLPVPQTTLPRNALIAGGIVLSALVVLGGWLMTRKPEPGPSPTALPAARSVGAPAGAPAGAPVSIPGRDAALEDLLARAQKALDAGALVAPPADNAADLYRQASRLNGDDPRPASGIERVIGQLLSAAETQLSAGHIEEAQKLTEQARSIKPDHVRVAFLAAQLGKERERALLTRARQAASSGNLEQAIAVLDGASREERQSTLVAEAREELEQKKLAERVNGYVAKAADRTRRGQLVEPSQDNAQFFIESARALAPNDAEVRQAERQLSDRLVSEARKELAAGNPDQAQRWIDAAADSGASRDEIAALTREQQRVQAAAKADAMARLALLFNQRITQGHVLDPPNDSAEFYLTQLVQSDATHPSTVLARQVMAARALDEAQAAVRRQDYTGARRWLTEAHGAGVDASSAGPVERELSAAQDSAKGSDEFASAGALQQTHYSPPVFPISARERGISGWVDVQFVVRPDGSVSDVIITGAEPVGIFEQAAVDAVRKWRYRPVVRNGQAVDQRARLRMKFALEH